MDTTYVTIMLVVFLVVTGLAIDIGYLYVSEDDLKGTAETAALAGAQAIKQRFLFEIQNDPKKLQDATNDTIQPAARSTAIETVSGKLKAAALMEISNSNGNALTGDNDVTVGFWNISSRSYTPGGTPVNAIQVRTKRTAESASVGLGSLGSFLAKITGTESFGLTPVAIAANPVGTNASVAFCSEACEPSCTYPEVCSIKEKRMTTSPSNRPALQPAGERFLFTSLLHPVTLTNTMSDMVCHEMPQQEVCGKPIYAWGGANNDILRDIKAMMYDPKVDSGNKEYDRNGRLVGWWMVVPVADCTAVKAGEAFEQHTVTKYSLVRISRVCASGAAGCGHGASASAASACGAGEEGLYIDRISCVGCGSKSKAVFPGLHPVLVGE